MEYFPFFVNLQKFTCLLVGGGDIALNKASLLLQAKANIRLIATTIKPELRELLQQNNSVIHQRAFKKQDLQDCEIVIVATDNKQFNQQVWQLAKQHNKWVNVVDDAEKCDFIFPAIVNRADLTIAISTSGVAPTIASWLRSKLETELPQAWSAIMHNLKLLQPKIRQNLTDLKLRRRFYCSLIDTVLSQLLNQPTKVSELAKPLITKHLLEFNNLDSTKEKQGKVYLVGGGPGDPELMTVRAQQILQQADIILYDRLLDKKILDYARRDSKKIYVGKQANNHHTTQSKINHSLLSLAQQGNIVVRLKGGDPFIFGRGGEEMKVLQEHDISVEIVSGVSSVNGIAANLGIPLTLRGIADKLLLTSIYANQQQEINWHQLVLPRQTLVLYMGLKNLTEIATNLIKYGLPASTPIALVEKGTWHDQKVVYTTLKSTASNPHKLNSPVLIIIGEVVNHRRDKCLTEK